MKIRTIKEEDINSVLKICNFHIKNSQSNFEEKNFSYKNFLDLTNKILDSNLPFLVCEDEENILGFAYLKNFRNKSGYRYSFENSIYINNKFIGLGIGSKLLKQLVKVSSKNKKIKTIIAVIAKKNSESSIKIHKKNGFKVVGTLKKIGFKNNQWLDTIYMQKIFHEKD